MRTNRMGGAAAGALVFAACFDSNAIAQTPATPAHHGLVHKITTNGLDIAATEDKYETIIIGAEGACDRATFTHGILNVKALKEIVQEDLADALSNEVRAIQAGGATTQAAIDKALAKERDVPTTDYGALYNTSLQLNRELQDSNAFDWAHCQPTTPTRSVAATAAKSTTTTTATTLTAGTPTTGAGQIIEPVVLLASNTTVQMAPPHKPPAPAGKPASPILTGGQSSYITISTQAGTCPCTSCTLRAGSTTVRFEYDPDKKGDLDAQGSAAQSAATKQAAADVKTQAASAGLCASSCTPQGVSTTSRSSLGYGGSYGSGSASAGWTVTGSCVDTKTFVALPDHPTISMPATGVVTANPTPSTVKSVTQTYTDKPSYTDGTTLTEEKPSYTAAAPTMALPTAKSTTLTVPTVKPTTLTIPEKTMPNAAPLTCPKGQTLVTVAGKSLCSGAAATAHIG